MSDHEHSRPTIGEAGDDATQLLEFIRQSREIIALPHGSFLFQEGEPCRGVYYVEEGELELTILSGDKRLTVGTASSGYLLAIAPVIANGDHQCSAHAITDSRLLFVPAESMREHLRHHAEICLLTVEKLGAELLDLSEKTIRPLRLQPRYHKPQ